MTRPARDPGLQPERTALAWQRTVLGVVIGSVLLAAVNLRVGQPVLSVLAGALAVATLVPTVLRPPSGGLPRDGRLHSWGFLVRVASLVGVLGFLGAASAVVSLL
ncbi:DUF202 domain-containing protein [Oerskovia sp. KBS0722]|uniref:DUF202 domain-containing protein n=1 Tax=Oerskovia sp. KBS0722 TaxID=1179673 RepID=UPI00110D785F|nr:DUF202 domain-containing protein [Oerskovia sp. KBS0722]QDW63907.1 DUF202 domain-containing protein [Oerskovia sp. KBS0722]